MKLSVFFLISTLLLTSCSSFMNSQDEKTRKVAQSDDRAGGDMGDRPTPTTNEVGSNKDVVIKVGEMKTYKYWGKFRVSCLGDQTKAAAKKFSSDNFISRGGALDSEDSALMLQGEYFKTFSLLPTKVSVSCFTDESSRREELYNQQGKNAANDYNDYRTMNNKYWECKPGGLTGPAHQENFIGRACIKEEAYKNADFKCYQANRNNEMRRCEVPVSCYIVKMDPSVMCDYIIPDEAGNYRSYPSH